MLDKLLSRIWFSSIFHMRKLIIILPLLVITVIGFILWQVSGSVLHFEVAVTNRAAILPNEGYNYLTDEPLLFSVQGEAMSVPTGFKTDLATIPRWMWMLISPSRSDIIEASIIHDYLYTCPGTLTRTQVDSIFYAALMSQGVPEYSARILFIAVRLFGHNHFGDRFNCYPTEGLLQGEMEEWIQDV